MERKRNLSCHTHAPLLPLPQLVVGEFQPALVAKTVLALYTHSHLATVLRLNWVLRLGTPLGHLLLSFCLFFPLSLVASPPFFSPLFSFSSLSLSGLLSPPESASAFACLRESLPRFGVFSQRTASIAIVPVLFVRQQSCSLCRSP